MCSASSNVCRSGVQIRKRASSNGEAVTAHQAIAAGLTRCGSLSTVSRAASGRTYTVWLTGRGNVLVTEPLSTICLRCRNTRFARTVDCANIAAAAAAAADKIQSIRTRSRSANRNSALRIETGPCVCRTCCSRDPLCVCVCLV